MSCTNNHIRIIPPSLSHTLSIMYASCTHGLVVTLSSPSNSVSLLSAKPEYELQGCYTIQKDCHYTGCVLASYSMSIKCNHHVIFRRGNLLICKLSRQHYEKRFFPKTFFLNLVSLLIKNYFSSTLVSVPPSFPSCDRHSHQIT